MFLYKEDRRPLIRYDVLFHRSLISCFLGKMPALAGLAGLPARLGRGAGTVASKPGGPVRQKKTVGYEARPEHLHCLGWCNKLIGCH